MVEIINDVGATQALVYPEPTARRNKTFITFGAPRGKPGNMTNDGTSAQMIPNGKHAWADMRRIVDACPAASRVSFKS